MHQHPSESVSNFAHRFLETQHSLEKLLPGIHSSADGNQMELVHAFSMKLQPEIAKFLISREEPFSDILVAIECAKRHEIRAQPTSDESSPQPAVSLRPEALYAAHPAHNNTPKFEAQKPAGMPNEICRNFNRFSPSRCELPHNKCMNGYLHKCSTCNKFNCKALNHGNNAQPPRNYARRNSFRFSQ